MGQPATGERSQTLAAVAAWGTAVDWAGAAVGVRETVEETVERRWMSLALTSYARRMWEREGAASQLGRATEEEDGGCRRRAHRGPLPA